MLRKEKVQKLWTINKVLLISHQDLLVSVTFGCFPLTADLMMDYLWACVTCSSKFWPQPVSTYFTFLFALLWCALSGTGPFQKMWFHQSSYFCHFLCIFCVCVCVQMHASVMRVLFVIWEDTLQLVTVTELANVFANTM